ncbi:MAG: GntR family transcriptional regulator [Desulfobacterales bacterium]|nr:GntR family transcriptional regulator [Desulfobacterales bacterium]
MKVESLVDIATKYIEEQIVTGNLKPGDQIKEEEVVKQLDISRPPVREALKSLEGEGLVIRRPRKGAFVSEMTRKDIWEIYTLKAELYAMAAIHAIDRITPEEIRQLNLLVTKMEKTASPERKKVLQYQKHHRAFHIKIMEIAGNQRLLKFAASLHKQIRRYSFQTLSYEDHLNRSNIFHQRIAGYIENKDKENAARLMREHIMDAMKFLLDIPGVIEGAGSGNGNRESA